MSRPRRHSPGGGGFPRAQARRGPETAFTKNEDFLAFERVVEETHCPGQGFVAEASRDIVVHYICRDRSDHLWRFGVRSKPACRPRRTAVRGCMLIDTRKPGRRTCGLRKTRRLVG